MRLALVADRSFVTRRHGFSPFSSVKTFPEKDTNRRSHSEIGENGTISFFSGEHPRVTNFGVSARRLSADRSSRASRASRALNSSDLRPCKFGMPWPLHSRERGGRGRLERGHERKSTCDIEVAFTPSSSMGHFEKGSLLYLDLPLTSQSQQMKTIDKSKKINRFQRTLCRIHKRRSPPL